MTPIFILKLPMYDRPNSTVTVNTYDVPVTYYETIDTALSPSIIVPVRIWLHLFEHYVDSRSDEGK